MALLIHWLGQADRVGLQSGGASFSELARQWLQRLESALAEESLSDAPAKLDWSLAQKFIDQLDSNAGPYLQPPRFMLTGSKYKPREAQDLVGADFDSVEDFDDGDDNDEEKRPYGSAYEDVVYEDSTDDGNESETAEEGSDNQDELQLECNRLGQHLTFLTALAQIWKTAALSPHVRKQIQQGGAVSSRCLEALEMWSSQAASNREGLLGLIGEVNSYAISKAGADTDAMSRYDRQRVLKESLLERIISTAVETSDARRMLLAALYSSGQPSRDALDTISSLHDDDRLSIEIFGYLLKGDHEEAEHHMPRLLAALRTKCLLYIPLARGGDAERIYNVRLRRRVLSQLLVWLPRQGLFTSACQLIETARFMEHHNPVGNGAITEFDDMFKLPIAPWCGPLSRTLMPGASKSSSFFRTQ